MADLGSIEFREGQRGTGEARSASNNDILKSLQNLGDIAVAARKEDILGDLREDLKDTTAAVQASQVPPPDPTGDVLFDRLQTLQHAVAQGDRKQVDIAKLEGRKVLSEVMQRFPGMRRELLTEFQTFVSSDPTLLALGFSDLAGASISKQAQAEIDEIKNQAYGDGEGQFGMDPGVARFGSQTFVDQYLHFAQMEAARNQSARTLAALSSVRALKADDMVPQWQKAVYGAASAVTPLINDAITQFEGVARALADPTSEGATRKLDDWNNFQQRQALANIDQGIATIKSSFLAEVPTDYVGTPAYERVEKFADAAVAQLNIMREAVAQNSPSSAAVYEGVEVARNLEYERRNPEVIQLRRVFNDFKVFLENVDTFTGVEFPLKNQFGVLAGDTLQTVIGRELGMTGSRELPANLSSEALEAEWRVIRMDNPSSNAHGIKGTEAAQTAAYQEIVGTHAALLEQAKMGDQLSPDFAMESVGGAYQSMKALTDRKDPPAQNIDEMLDMFATPAWNGVVKRTTESSQPEANTLFGDTLVEFLDKSSGPGGTTTRFQEYKNQFGNAQHLNGIPLSSVIKVNTSKLSEGTITFEFDEEAAIRAVAPTLGLPVGSGRNLVALHGATRSMVDVAKRATRELGARISRDLRVMALAHQAQSKAASPNFEAAWAGGDFHSMQQIFDPQEEE